VGRRPAAGSLPLDACRRARVGSGQYPPGLKRPCAVEKLENGVFRVRPKQPLPAGEYAFTVAREGQGGQVWDFGVDVK
jgi:hypothetical protein